MLYKIKDKYYILVGNKYVEVKFSIKDDNVSLSPDSSSYIEKNGNIVVKQQMFDDKFKEELKKKHYEKPKEKEQYDSGVRKNRYNR